jgi:hypothetical protein
MLRLQLSALDYSILAYFLVFLGIGAVARLSVKTDVDFFFLVPPAAGVDQEDPATESNDWTHQCHPPRSAPA